MVGERKKRITITMDTIKLIRGQIEKNKKPSEIADSLNISYGTALSLYNKILSGLPNEQLIVKKGRRKKDITELKNLIRSFILEDNSLTQEGIIQRLAESGIHCSQSQISEILKEMQITRKRLSLVPAERNAPHVLDARQEYARDMSTVSIRNIVYLDETGFNLHTAKHYGYSPVGQKAYITVPANRGQNISLMAAISISGIVGYELRDGAFNRESFGVFISEKLITYFRENPGSILVMDNCSFHHCAEILSLLSSNNISYRFLPAYSPQLNPIEEFFGELKANYESIRPLATTRDEVKSRVDAILSSRTGDFIPNFEKARDLLPNAIARQDMY